MTHQQATVGDRIGHTLARQGLTVWTRDNWSQGSVVLVISIDGRREVRIADVGGGTHGDPSEWSGGRVVVCSADEDSGTMATGSLVYESPGPGDFLVDSARLISAVTAYLKKEGHTLQPDEQSEVHRERALAYVALADAGWRPRPWDDPECWRGELRAGHAAYREGKVVAVGVDELDTLRNAATDGSFDVTPYANLTEALDAVRQGGMSSWQRTPYGIVWIDDAA